MLSAPVDCLTAVLLALFCVALIVRWKSTNSRNVPPGPAGLPIVGSLHTFAKAISAGKLVEYLEELNRKYGAIASINCGAQRFVFINNNKLLSEVFQSPVFSVRPNATLPALQVLSMGSENGLMFGNGEPHDEMRRFSLLTLRDLGVGKKTLDEMIQLEAADLGQQFEKLIDNEDGIVDNVGLKLQIATSNSMHHIIFGFRYEHDDPTWVHLMEQLRELEEINPLSFPANYFPILQKIPLLNYYISNNIEERYAKLNHSAAKYLSSQIEEHRAAYTEGEIKDFVDLYLKYESEQKKYYTTDNIYATMLDLFKAGTATVAVTFVWAIIILVKQPNTQKIIAEEINRVIGDRTFDRKDRDKLPKTKAFLNEVNRYSSIAPLSGPHTATKPVTINGYSLIPGDVVFGCLYAINHDKAYWKDPYKFRFERWLDEDGNLKKHSLFYLPFSVGKRVCPGRQFANIQLMLILVSFLQKFTFHELPDTPDKVDLAAGFLRIPEHFSFKVKRRA